MFLNMVYRRFKDGEKAKNIVSFCRKIGINGTSGLLGDMGITFSWSYASIYAQNVS